MPCACKRCLHHCRTLGLAARAPSKAAVRRAFRSEAKLWHPDRFENDPVKRHEAEEHFKGIQVAYRELWEHCENPEESRPGGPAPEATVKKVEPEEPVIFFGDAAGCYAPPHLPRRAEEVIVAHLEERERVLGFVDLSGGGSRSRNFSRYILLTNQRVIVRDAMDIVSLVWYADLGKITLVDLHKDGNPSVWQKIVEKLSGVEKRYVLQIHRSNGTHFYSITGQTDDSVKKVVYNFLLQKKSQPRS
jgi:hypothetical protein